MVRCIFPCTLCLVAVCIICLPVLSVFVGCFCSEFMSRLRAGPHEVSLVSAWCWALCFSSVPGGTVPVTGQIWVCMAARSVPAPRHPRTTEPPMGPATLYCFCPHELLGWCMGFLSSFWSIVWGSVHLWGISDVSFVGPSSFALCSVTLVFSPPFFSLYCLVPMFASDAVSCFLSPSLSFCFAGAEKPETPFEFWVSLVYHPDHGHPHLLHRRLGRLPGFEPPPSSFPHVCCCTGLD